MATRRRCFQFSLRTAFVVLTISCLWFGWKLEQARKQAEAVTAIKAAGGVLQYDWQTEPERWLHFLGVRFSPGTDTPPKIPAILERVVGSDFFQEVHGVLLNAWYIRRHPGLPILSEADKRRPKSKERLRAVIPHLKKLPALRVIYLEEPHDDIFGQPTVIDDLEAELRNAVPHCRIVRDKIFTTGQSWPNAPPRPLPSASRSVSK
jgi:hypothetical protein